MTVKEIKHTTKRLEHLMQGFNYEVTYGIDTFDSCTTLDDFNRKLKEIHTDTRPNDVKPILFDNPSFWEEIDFGLTFRGDSAAGLSLSPEREKELLIEQTEYKEFIKHFISDKTKIYSYPDEQGIPGYIVYWGYSFILLNTDSQSLFVYGSASD